MSRDPAVPCPRCGSPFDPLAGEWCGSRRGAHTPVCPACGECLCGLPPEAQEGFWRTALGRAEPATPAAAGGARETPPVADAPEPPPEASWESHEIACLRCGEPYDAAIAAECGCATAIPTPVCPHCKRCLCDEPMQVQIGFWASAPEGMRRRTVSALRAAELAAAERQLGVVPRATRFRSSVAPPTGTDGLVDLASFLNPAEAAPVETFEVRCKHCASEYDALTAAWCFCIGNERSTLCPECLRCICAEDKEFRQRWWADAHPHLRAKRIAELRAPFHTPVPPAPTLLARPAAVVAYRDDERLRIAGRALSLLGCGVVFARDGVGAFTRVKSHRPELLLADAILPHLNGRELCLRIKADPAARDVKVILTTGIYTRPSNRDEAYRKYRVDDWLLEPVGIHTLRDSLEKLLPAGKPVTAARG